MKKSLIVKIEEVVADPMNPRQEFDPVELQKLETSIRKNGIMSPIAVEETNDGKYLIIDGERRYRSAKRLKLKEVPIVVMEPMTDVERMVKRFNLQEQHASWTAWEKAHAIQSLQVQTGMTTDELSSSLGITRSQVDKFIMITSLTKRMATKISERKLPFDWIVEIGRIIKTVPEDVREKMENAMVEKIDAKVVMKARELRRYRMAIATGDNEVLKKILNNKLYSPSMASLEAGTQGKEAVMYLHTHLSGARSYAAKVLASKTKIILSEAFHRNVVDLLKQLNKLEGMDYETREERSERRASEK